jgi:hypothetical protein
VAYVYIYYDPRFTPAIPIYVGKGVKDRMYHHLTSKCHNFILTRKLNKIKLLGLAPIIEKITENDLSHEEAAGLEMSLIAEYGRINNKTGSLCNFTDGGEGTIGYKHRNDTLELFSYQRKGKKQTEAQYAANCNRAPQTEETRIRKSIGNKGHSRHSEKQLELLKNQEYGARRFLVTLPDNTQIEILNLSKFCKQYHLDRTTCTKSATANTIYKGFQFQRI